MHWLTENSVKSQDISWQRKCISWAVALVCACALATAGCGQSRSSTAKRTPESGKGIAGVDAAAIANADLAPGNWMTYGRTYAEQRFSPLQQITDKNVNQLGLAWYLDLDTRRGQESTPLVIDGVMYFTTAWSKVVALVAATGARLWSYDPKVPPAWAVNACCDVVNRGVAAWKGKVFVGTLDGRLIALDAARGQPVWETQTFEPGMRYTITGAPRLVKGKSADRQWRRGNGRARLYLRV